MRLLEIRCPECGKLLGKFSGSGEIKCNRCKKIVEFNTVKKNTN